MIERFIHNLDTQYQKQLEIKEKLLFKKQEQLISEMKSINLSKSLSSSSQQSKEHSQILIPKLKSLLSEIASPLLFSYIT